MSAAGGDGTPTPIFHSALKWLHPRDYLIARRDTFPMPAADVSALAHAARSFVSDSTGATAIEYALIAGIVSIVIVGAVTSMGVTLKGFFTSVAGSLR